MPGTHVRTRGAGVARVTDCPGGTGTTRTDGPGQPRGPSKKPGGTRAGAATTRLGSGDGAEAAAGERAGSRGRANRTNSAHTTATEARCLAEQLRDCGERVRTE